VPPEEAATAEDTLGGAVAVSETLPAPLGTELLDAAREAFTQGLQVAAFASAVIAAVTAAVAVIYMRNVRPEPAGETTSAAVEGEPVPAAE
jgi:DHA2 family multidrug resistance protein-like MFS transporter